MHGKKLLVASLSMIVALPLTTCSPAVTAVKAVTPTTFAVPTPTAKSRGAEPNYGGTLLSAINNTIPHFDMHQETTFSMQFPLSSSYDMLVRNDAMEEDKIVGNLARSWDISPNGLIYTFRLQEGVKFHDGTSLVAEDVKFNLDRVIFPPKGMISPRKPLYEAVEKVETFDPVTLRIFLKRPQASFLQLLSIEKNFVFLPRIIREKGDMKKDVLGTGPFKFVSYTEGVSFKVQKNPDYFVKGRPYLDGITIYVMIDETARVAALRTK
ncbi:MAG: hypothetical protein HYX92_08320 [Chloroflexi bacterium]|nr:hypothetical protein [Chloroflexota bacterium]